MKRFIIAFLISAAICVQAQAIPQSNALDALPKQNQTYPATQFEQVQTILRTQDNIIQKLRSDELDAIHFKQWLRANHAALQRDLALSEPLRKGLFPNTIYAKDAQGFLLNNYKQKHLLTAEERKHWYEIETQAYQINGTMAPRDFVLEELLGEQGFQTYDFVLKADHSVKMSPIERIQNPLTEVKWAHPNHTILAGLDSVVSAGNFSLLQENGKRVFFISNKSGHFLPSYQDLNAFKDFLIQVGIPEEEIFTISMASFYANTAYKYFYTDQVKIDLKVLDPAVVHQYYLRIWQNAQKERVLEQTLSQIEKEGPLSVPVEAIVALKKDRKTAHWLRSAFYLFDQAHQPPADFENYVILYGKLNDALINRSSEAVLSATVALRTSLNHQKVSEAAQYFKPTTTPLFFKNLADIHQKIDDSLQQPGISIQDMHMARIYFKQYLNLYQTLNNLYPYHSLTEVNIQRLEHVIGFLGEKHDDFIEAELRSKLQDNSLTIEFTDEEKEYMHDVLEKAHQPTCHHADIAFKHSLLKTYFQCVLS